MRPSRSPAQRLARRRRSRGAALVEAAVVIPLLVIFLGWMQYFHATCSKKIESQAMSRRGALYLASHMCLSAAPGEGQSFYAVGQAIAEAVPIPEEGNAPREGLDYAIYTTPMMAKSVASLTASGGGRSRTMKSTSYVFCNAQTFVETIEYWVQFGVGFLAKWI